LAHGLAGGTVSPGAIRIPGAQFNAAAARRFHGERIRALGVDLTEREEPAELILCPGATGCASGGHVRGGVKAAAPEGSMRLARTVAVALGAITLLAAAQPTSSRATDIDDYRANHYRTDCRIVETHTTNRWGDDVTVRHLVCP
jgi:hypothetical protein